MCGESSNQNQQTLNLQSSVMTEKAEDFCSTNRCLSNHTIGNGLRLQDTGIINYFLKIDKIVLTSTST